MYKLPFLEISSVIGVIFKGISLNTKALSAALFQGQDDPLQLNICSQTNQKMMKRKKMMKKVSTRKVKKILI